MRFLIYRGLGLRQESLSAKASENAPRETHRAFLDSAELEGVLMRFPRKFLGG